MEYDTTVTWRDLHSYNKVIWRSEELAKKWLKDNNYDPSGFEYTKDIECEGEFVYFEIHWQYPDYRGTDLYEIFEVKFPEEEFCKER